MLKGVNRQLVEINDSGCEYFERVLFIVKPEYSSVSEARLRESAKTITSFATAPPPSRKRDKGDFLLSLAKFIAYASIGALICAFVIYGIN